MRCFSTEFSCLEGRLDADYYLHNLQQYKGISAVKTLPLGELVEFSKETWDQKSVYDTDFPYIEISEINIEAGRIENISWVPVVEAPSRAKMVVRTDDIIVSTTRPHRGAIVQIDSDYDGYIASTGFSVIRKIKKKDLNRKFLYHVLRTDFVLLQMLQRSSGGNYPAITSQELKQVEMPVPKKDTQDQIVALMDKAYAEKKALEDESDKLLASIDSYMLDQLGVVLSGHAARKIYTVSSKVLEPVHDLYSGVGFSRYFCASASHVHLCTIRCGSRKTAKILSRSEIMNRFLGGKRADPLYYSQEILSFIESLTYDHPKIADCVEYIQSGFAAGRGNQELEKMDEAIIQIRPTNMNNSRELVFDKNVYVHKDILSERPDHLLKKGEVLFNNTNSQDLVGKSVFFDIEGEYACSNHVTRLYPKADELDGYYLYCILNLYQRLRVFYSICTNWNNQSGVGSDLLGSLPIPKPTLAKQEAIAKEIRSRIEKAAELRKKSDTQLAQAKAEVEKILFGGTA